MIYPPIYPPHRVPVLITPPQIEPLTLTEAKLAAGLDWPAGDPRDAQLFGFLAAARAKVETDTGVALLTQTVDVHYDDLPLNTLIALPLRPVQELTVHWTDGAGGDQTLDPGAYWFDPSSAAPLPARIVVGDSGADVWPPWIVRCVVGHAAKDALLALAPALVHAVALLTAHYATAGRDAVVVGTIASETPLGYADLIAPYQLVSLI